jgi:hypothetical protein
MPTLGESPRLCSLRCTCLPSAWGAAPSVFHARAVLACAARRSEATRSTGSSRRTVCRASLPLLWLATERAPAFGRVEKAPEFYVHNGFFSVKMGLFSSFVALEIGPIVTFVRWRIAAGRGGRCRNSTDGS